MTRPVPRRFAVWLTTIATAVAVGPAVLPLDARADTPGPASPAPSVSPSRAGTPSPAANAAPTPGSASPTPSTPLPTAPPTPLPSTSPPPAPASPTASATGRTTDTAADAAIGITLDKPAARVDSLKAITLRGRATPAKAGVVVHLDVWRGGRFRLTTTARTNGSGEFRASVSYGKGRLARYRFRATYQVDDDRWARSGSRTVTRVAVLNAVITRTTASEVAKTYRAGCPVGRSKLRTITMNYYGRDKRMHRGVLIVRSSLTGKVTRGFSSALKHRYPIAKMRNPNVYGGHDPTQMAANNTSGFNCRKVVGNPYAQSPHSYGIAIDVNTVQNPYRDATGKWWPTNGKSYIDRSKHRRGMLYRGSYLTKSLRHDGFFWGGLWSPGRDYQHFEH